MGMNRGSQMEQQGNLDFGQAETLDEKRKRLIESIRRKREKGESLNKEESDFIDEERADLDDNPYQNKRVSH
jgi:hypothetical protein